jgi:hypothetical protein
MPQLFRGRGPNRTYHCWSLLDTKNWIAISSDIASYKQLPLSEIGAFSLSLPAADI